MSQMETRVKTDSSTDSSSVKDVKTTHKIDHDKALELYNAGMVDREIGKTLKFSTKSICDWRNRNNLPSNSTKYIDYDKVKEQYDLGKSDGEIAKELGCSPLSIFLWRKKNNLVATHTPFTESENVGKAGYESSQTYDPESILYSPRCIDFFIKGIKHG